MKSVGKIEGEVIDPPEHFIIQLLDNQYNVVQELDDANPYEFSYLDPNAYYLRLIDDRNNNGRWDPGTYENEIPPEDVVLLSESINVKANWELTGVDIRGNFSP